MKNIIAIVLVLVVAGCATSRPYTARERRAVAHAVVGQSLDCVTTSMSLQDERFSEQNNIWWNPEDTGSMLAGKAALIGVVYLIGEIWPDARYAMFLSIGGAGYTCAGWNTYQMIKHDVDPWK